MFEVKFYEKADGTSQIRDMLDDLNHAANTNKNARIRRNKIIAYIDKLCQYGTRVGEPVVKHLDGDIWELRPLNDRIMFFYEHNGVYVLLHSFVKKTQKTPRSEIAQAKREMKDHIERGEK